MRILIVLIIAVASLAALPTVANAYVHDCSGNGYGPRNDRGAPNRVTSVRNISCHAAGAAVDRGFLVTGGNLRTRGFHCYILHRYRVGNQLNGADVRCVHGGAAFRWIWGT